MAEATVRQDSGALASLQLKIGGMSCSFCVNAIERGLDREKGVESVPDMRCAACVSNIRLYLGTEAGVDRVEGDAETKTLRIAYRPGRIGPAEIKARIAELGYTPR